MMEYIFSLSAIVDNDNLKKSPPPPPPPPLTIVDLKNALAIS